MDDQRFDRLARALGEASTRRGALAALAALGLGAGIAPEARARKKCRPRCGAGQSCHQGECRCNEGTICGTACCRIGQTCDAGTCVEMPEPDTCIAFGEACKNAGVPCCDGLVCGSGQGGAPPACYAVPGGSCQTTADCAYGSSCKDGACIADPAPTPAPSCAASVPVTGVPAVDGAALKAAILAAQSGATITLAAGTYQFAAPANVGGPADSGVHWTQGSLTIEACPGEDVTLTMPPTAAFYAILSVTGGSLSVRNLELLGQTISGPARYGVYANGSAAMATLDHCTVTGFTYGALSIVNATVTIIGGNYVGNSTNALRINGGTFFCSENPVMGTCSSNAIPATCNCTNG